MKLGDIAYAYTKESPTLACQGKLVAFSESGVWAYLECIEQRGKSGKTFVKKHYKVLTATLKKPLKGSAGQ